MLGLRPGNAGQILSLEKIEYIKCTIYINAYNISSVYTIFIIYTIYINPLHINIIYIYCSCIIQIYYWKNQFLHTPMYNSPFPSLSSFSPIPTPYNLCSNHWAIYFSLNPSVPFPSLVSAVLNLFPKGTHIRNDIPMCNDTTHIVMSRFWQNPKIPQRSKKV